LGWGAENFSAVFDKHLDTRHFVPGQNSETWFDRAHSVVFDYLAETGALGFLSYLTMLGVALFGVLRLPRAEEAKNALQGVEKSVVSFFRRLLHPSSDIGPMASRGPLVRAAVIAIIVAYFGQGMFLFDVLPIYIPLFLVMAFLVREVYNTEN
jgi:O-antigen ligase